MVGIKGNSERAEIAGPKKAMWFERSAVHLQSFARAHGTELLRDLTVDANCYLCPLCLRPTTNIDLGENGILSLEHAPPDSVGGWEVTLTCRPCNNKLGGSKVDSHVANFRRLSEFFGGATPAVPERISYTVGDTTIRADLYIGPDSIGFAGVPNPRANKPSDRERMQENIDAALSESKAKITTHLRMKRRYNANLEDLSWIRTAYLATFATFWLAMGYESLAGADPDAISGARQSHSPKYIAVSSGAFGG